MMDETITGHQMLQVEEANKSELPRQPSAAEDAAVAMMESAARREQLAKKQLPWWKKLFGNPNREN